MGVRLLIDTSGTASPLVAMYCSTDMVAFGPVFYGEEEAQDFLKWLAEESGMGDDPRKLTAQQLSDAHGWWFPLAHDEDGEFVCRTVEEREPTDNEIYNRYGVEGGIAYSTAGDEPGSLGENDWRL